MTLDFFNNLSEDEKSAYLQGAEANETLLKDNEAEISSLKSENETLKAGSTKLEDELLKTKEMNFTLARQVDASQNRPTFEDTLHDCFIRKE